jgi:DUF4097 and DUF4098 domain-containing protein YvlB
MRALISDDVATRGGVALAVATALAVVGCGGDEPTVPDIDEVVEQDLSEFEIDVTSQSRVKLNAKDGTIRIRGVANADSVRVDGVRRVESTTMDSAAAYLIDLDVVSSVSADAIRIETSHPDPLSSVRYSVDYDVTVPQGMEVEIENACGDVYAVTVYSSLAVTTGHGNVTLWDVHGSASVYVDRGYIAAVITVPEHGTVDLGVRDGTIGLDIPLDTSAQLSATTTGGLITVSNLELADPGADSSTSVTGTLGAGDGSIALEATMGDVTVSGYDSGYSLGAGDGSSVLEGMTGDVAAGD